MRDAHDEAPTAAATLARVQTEVGEKQAEFDLLRRAHERLWQDRKVGRLDREGYVDFLWSEDRMAALFQELEHLRPRLLLAEVTEQGLAAKAHFDAYCPVSRRSPWRLARP